jgi:hypothetical protein
LALVILEIGSCFLCIVILFYASWCHWNNNHTLPFSAFFHWGEMRFHKHFAWVGLKWQSSNLSLPNSLGWQVHATTPSYWLRWGLMKFLQRLALNTLSSCFNMTLNVKLAKTSHDFLNALVIPLCVCVCVCVCACVCVYVCVCVCVFM